MTIKDLAQKTGYSVATISRALDYLEKNDFIACPTAGAKRYKSPLVLTEKGAVVGKKIADKIDGVLGEISGGLSEDARVAFYRSLTIISDSLDAVAAHSQTEEK